MPVTNPGYYLCFLPTSYRVGVPTTPSLRFARTAHRIQGNNHVNQFTKGYDKGYKQPDEEIHGRRPGRVQSAGAPCRHAVRVRHPPGEDVFAA